MKIVLISATEKEISPLIQTLNQANSAGNYRYQSHTISILITGAGMVQTAWALGKNFQENKYDLAIQAGIAGSFRDEYRVGDVVRVTEDIFPELGAEDGLDFIPADKLEINAPCRFTNTLSLPFPVLASLPMVKAITVNRIHGNEESIRKIILQFQPDIESMEGAAFFYCCEKEKLPCLQIRSVSNKIEKRNKENWNIPLAVKNLNEKLLAILSSLQ